MNPLFLSLFVALGVSNLCLGETPSLLGNSKKTERISEARWNYLVGDKSSITYTVRSGDTLSRISQEQLGDLSYWPKIWEVNQESIHNPHLLEPEQKILFSRAEAPISREPNNETLDPIKRKSLEESPDQLLSSGYSNQHRLRFLVLEGEEILGIITGSYDDKNFFGSESKIYIGPLIKEKLLVGKKYAVIREVEKTPLISKPVIQLVGEVEIEAYGDELARAVVLSAYDTFERGDRVMDIPALSMQEASLTPPPDLSTRVLLGDNLEHTWFHEGQLLVLDKGREAGIKLGHLFKVFDDTDPILKDQQLVEPTSKGEVKIVHLSEKSSVGYILKSRAGIEVGDVLLSQTQLPDPVNKINTNRQTVTLE
jgi:hypothetical protein